MSFSEVRKKIKYDEKVIGTKNVLVDTLLFSLLPNEIVRKIFTYLSPKDLIFIERLENQRLTSLAHTIGNASFYSYRSIPAEDMTCFFSQGRVQYITRINFDFLYNVIPSVLEKSICKCRNLETLSVLCCGLYIQNITNILSRLKKVIDLTWDLQNVPNSEINSSKIIASFSSIKRLHLYVCTANNYMFQIMCTTGLQELELDLFLCDRHLVNRVLKSVIDPRFLVEVTKNPKASFKNLESFALKDHGYQLTGWQRRIGFIAEVPFANYTKLWMENRYFNENTKATLDAIINHLSNVKNGKPNFSYLLLLEDEVEALSHLPNNSIIALGFVLANVTLDLSEIVQRVGGKKLKHFMLHSEFPAGVEPVNPGKAMFFLTDIFLTCGNITVLDLCGYHFPMFNDGPPFQAIKNLKWLSRLSLSSCAFQKVNQDNESSLCPDFKELVESCYLVEHFSLCGCPFCNIGPNDSELMCIQKWTKLKHLVLMYAQSVRLCSFLMPVAQACTELCSLQIIDIGLGSCQYMPSMKYFLRTAKNLMFFRINQASLYLNDESFWNSLCQARKMEGICLSTMLSTVVPSDIVLKCISRIKALNLFHLKGSTGSENLEKRIRQSMASYGIKNRRVAIEFKDSKPMSYWLGGGQTNISFLPSGNCIQCCKAHFGIPFPNDFPKNIDYSNF